jgi:hypothetical protein
MGDSTGGGACECTGTVKGCRRLGVKTDSLLGVHGGEVKQQKGS